MLLKTTGGTPTGKTFDNPHKYDMFPMIQRDARQPIRIPLNGIPIAAPTGPRQSGKTTLAAPALIYGKPTAAGKTRRRRMDGGMPKTEDK